MEQAVYLETLARDRSVAVRTRIGRVPFTVGRAYDNDLIIDDAFVAPHHLRIETDSAGGLLARDLGSRNGMHDGNGKPVAWIELNDNALFRIGHTTLRVRATDHQVVPERVIGPERWLEYRAVPALALILLILLSLYEAYANAQSPRQTEGYITMPLTVIAITLAWGGAWALIGRLFSGRAQFTAHLAIAALGLLAVDLLESFFNQLAFALGSATIEGYAYIVVFGAVGLIVLAHLTLIQPGHRARSIWIAGLLAAVAIGVPMIRHYQRSGSLAETTFLTVQSWPALVLRKSVDVPTFFERAARIKTDVDQGIGDIGNDDAED